MALSTNDDKRMQSIYSVERYAFDTRTNLLCKKKRLNVTM